MLTIIDEVYAHYLDIGDITLQGTIVTIDDIGDEFAGLSAIVVGLDSGDEYTYEPFDLVGLYGMVYDVDV